MGSTQRREARTEALFRQVNERIAEQAEDGPVDVTTFICECGDPSCVDGITAPMEEYEEVRSGPRTFLVTPGHADDAIERVVAERDHYEVVEKTDPEAVDIVEETDPRS